jgi:RNA polymerase sigma-B factor
MAATITGARGFARQSDEELLERHWRERDLDVRDELFDRFLPFARKLAIRYMHSSEPVDDLVQVASLGLLNAIERFDPGQGKNFTAFAAPTILGELKRHFRDKGWAIRVPRDLKERALAVTRQAERLSSRLGRSPTVIELADALDCTLEQVVEAIHAGENYQLTSLDAPAVPQDDEDHCNLLELLGSEDAGFELVEDREALSGSWSQLPELERQALGLRLVHGLTQREISRRIGCSQMHVSRLLRRSMLSLTADAGPPPHRQGAVATGATGDPVPEPPVVSRDVIRVLNAAIHRAALIDGASMANAQLLDPKGAGLRIVAHTGFATSFLDYFDVVNDTESACGSALAAGTPVWVSDTARSPIFAGTPALEVMLDAGSRAVASIPLISPHGRLIGMISTHHRRPATWTDHRIDGLQSLATSTGKLLDNLMPRANYPAKYLASGPA